MNHKLAGVCLLLLLAGCGEQPSLTSVPDLPSRFEQLERVRKYDVQLGVPHGRPGERDRLVLYLPDSPNKQSLPCVFVARPQSIDVAEKPASQTDPYAMACETLAVCGFAVVSYEIDGEADLSNPNADADLAFKSFVASEAGLVNARHAMRFALEKIPGVDPERLFCFGEGSAGRAALLIAANDSKIKGCAVINPLLSVMDDQNVVWIARLSDEAKDEYKDAMKDYLPESMESKISCPVDVVTGAAFEVVDRQAFRKVLDSFGSNDVKWNGYQASNQAYMKARLFPRAVARLRRLAWSDSLPNDLEELKKGRLGGLLHDISAYDKVLADEARIEKADPKLHAPLRTLVDAKLFMSSGAPISDRTIEQIDRALKIVASVPPTEQDRDLVMEIVFQYMDKSAYQRLRKRTLPGAAKSFQQWADEEHIEAALKIIESNTDERSLPFCYGLAQCLVELDQREKILSLVNHPNLYLRSLVLGTLKDRWKMDHNRIARQILLGLQQHEHVKRIGLLVNWHPLEKIDVTDPMLKRDIARCVIENLGDSEFLSTKARIKLLNQYVDDHEMELLLEFVPSEPAKWYADLLASFNDPRTNARLIERAVIDQDYHCGFAILDNPNAFEQQILTHAKHKSVKVQSRVIRLLGKMGSGSSVPTLQQFAEDAAHREAAGLALRRVNARLAGKTYSEPITKDQFLFDFTQPTVRRNLQQQLTKHFEDQGYQLIRPDGPHFFYRGNAMVIDGDVTGVIEGNVVAINSSISGTVDGNVDVFARDRASVRGHVMGNVRVHWAQALHVNGQVDGKVAGYTKSFSQPRLTGERALILPVEVLPGR